LVLIKYLSLSFDVYQYLLISGRLLSIIDKRFLVSVDNPDN